MIKCPECNKELVYGARFCDSCGAEVSKHIFCPSCGNHINPESNFCQYCNAPVKRNLANTEMKKTGKIVLACIVSAFLLFLIVAAIGVKVYLNKKEPVVTEVTTEETTEYDDGFVSDYISGEENINGNTCENFAQGAFVAKQGSWIYYCSNEGIGKVNEDNGENIVVSYQENAKNIAICEEYIYFVSGADREEKIKRIRTDGLHLSEIATAGSFFFEEKCIYYVDKKSVGIDDYDYYIVKKQVDSISEEEIIYDLQSGEGLRGVYNGYVIISSGDDIILCDTKSFVPQKYEWKSQTAEIHFDENKLIGYTSNSLKIFDLSDKSTYEEDFFSDFKLHNISNGNYYISFFNGTPGFGGNYLLAYTWSSLIDGYNSQFVKLAEMGYVIDVNIIDDWVYYKSGDNLLNFNGIYRIDHNASESDKIYSRYD